MELYGINPRLLPVEMNGRICGYTAQYYEKSKLNKKEWPLSFEMERSATLVALCILGPANFPRYNKYGISMQHTVTAAAVACRNGGSGTTLETKIIQIVDEAGCLSQDFIDLYSIMLLPGFISTASGNC